MYHKNLKSVQLTILFYFIKTSLLKPYIFVKGSDGICLAETYLSLLSDNGNILKEDYNMVSV